MRVFTFSSGSGHRRREENGGEGGGDTHADLPPSYEDVLSTTPIGYLNLVSFCSLFAGAFGGGGVEGGRVACLFLNGHPRGLVIRCLPQDQKTHGSNPAFPGESYQ